MGNVDGMEGHGLVRSPPLDPPQSSGAYNRRLGDSEDLIAKASVKVSNPGAGVCIG